MPPPAPRILTLTGNLLWEHTLNFDAWSPGATQRAQSGSAQVGGKGINVAKMLRRLGANPLALAFAGGATGLECTVWLKAHGFDFRVFPSEHPTRFGVVVRGGAQPETTFFAPDASPGAMAVRACADFLDQQPDGEVLALCGSLPSWETADFDPLRAALERWLGRGRLVADTYGPPLAWLAQRPLDLIKINRIEFTAWQESLPPGTCLDPKDLRSVSPVRSWVVTDGPRPLWMLDESGAANEIAPPSIQEVSPTGSGDVLLACLLQARWQRGLSLPGAVAFALPYAAANAADAGVAAFSLPKKP